MKNGITNLPVIIAGILILMFFILAAGSAMLRLGS